MSSSLTLKQVAEQALREKVEMEARVKYLQTQLGQLHRKGVAWENQESPMWKDTQKNPNGRKTTRMVPLVKMVKQEAHFGLKKEPTSISR